MKPTKPTLFSEVRQYISLSQEAQSHLSTYPYDWPKFQERFNATLDKISLNILRFEKDNIIKSESTIYRLRKIFEQRYRKFFLYGQFPRWVYEKPFGYAGDFKIIDDIYQNQPRTIGFDGLWDHYFQQMVACRATRQRKVYFKKTLLDYIKNHQDKDIRILNLGSGSAREIKELFEENPTPLFSRTSFDCYDYDTNAIDYAKKLLNNPSNTTFYKKNAIRLALTGNIKKEIPNHYDLIYSTGLFDYLDDRVVTRLVTNLKKVLKKNGLLITANFGSKYNNSSAGLMEWATEWYLIYRHKSDFKRLFLNAGFSSEHLRIVSQMDNVVEYCFAHMDGVTP